MIVSVVVYLLILDIVQFYFVPHHKTTLLCVYIILFTGILSKKKTRSGVAVATVWM